MSEAHTAEAEGKGKDHKDGSADSPTPVDGGEAAHAGERRAGEGHTDPPGETIVAGNYRGPDRRHADRRGGGGGEHGRKHDVHKKFMPAIHVMTIAEIVAYLLVGATLLVMALVVIYRGGDETYGIIRVYISRRGDSANDIIQALSNFLFVVILMELLATVITHIRHETFQVKPFLIIGIISGVRQILLVGAKLSLNNLAGAEWRHAQIELGVNVGIDFALVVCLVLLKRFQVEKEEI